MNSFQEKATVYAGLERRVQTIMQTLGVEEGRPPSNDLELPVDADAVRPIIDQIEQAVKKVSDQLTGEDKRIEQLESILHQLEPIADIDLDISAVRNPRYLYATLGTLPVANIERLQTSLSRIPFVFLTLRQDPQKPVVWLAGSKTNSDILERAARSAYLDPVSLPEGYEGTPAEVIKLLHANIEAARKTISGLKEEMARLQKEYKQQLRGLLWDVRASRLLADAILRFGRLRYTYLIVGWVPVSSLDSLKERLKQVSKEILVETYPTKRARGNLEVPVALQHAKILQPFQMLVTTYARPLYGELDPTWIVALTFPLLFGAMFGDVGQGIVLALVGWLLSSRKVRMLQKSGQPGRIDHGLRRAGDRVRLPLRQLLRLRRRIPGSLDAAHREYHADPDYRHRRRSGAA